MMILRPFRPFSSFGQFRDFLPPTCASLSLMLPQLLASGLALALVLADDRGGLQFARYRGSVSATHVASPFVGDCHQMTQILHILSFEQESILGDGILQRYMFQRYMFFLGQSH